MEYDVLIIGGGSAGVAAALTSARQGVKTLLVERHGFLGGAGTASLVHSFCGLYDFPRPGEAVARVANPGIPTLLESELLARAIALGPMRLGRVDVLLHQPQQLALLYDQWCLAEPNLQVLLHTDVIGCTTAEGRVTDLNLFCRGASWTARPHTIVDASGDAVLALLADHPWKQVPSQELQRPAYIIALSGVAVDALSDNGPLQIAGTLARAIKEKTLPAEAAGAHFRMSPATDEIFLTLDLPGDSPECPFDATDARSLTWVEMRGRQVAFSIVDHLQTTLAGFAHARVSTLPVRAGIRESRRWIGESVLTEEDILESRNGEQAVANATWPLELRETARGPRLLYPHEPKPCGIPLGCLRARDLRNVFIAGRCISATHRAQASIRVMGTALATGQAAGLAAAELARNPGASTSDLARQVRKVLNGLAQ